MTEKTECLSKYAIADKVLNDGLRCYELHLRPLTEAGHDQPHRFFHGMREEEVKWLLTSQLSACFANIDTMQVASGTRAMAVSNARVSEEVSSAGLRALVGIGGHSFMTVQRSYASAEVTQSGSLGVLGQQAAAHGLGIETSQGAGATLAAAAEWSVDTKDVSARIHALRMGLETMCDY